MQDELCAPHDQLDDYEEYGMMGMALQLKYFIESGQFKDVQQILEYVTKLSDNIGDELEAKGFFSNGAKLLDEEHVRELIALKFPETRS